MAEVEEKASKKREWIKNVAIIFLAVMLLLTFFSNTIMNYSLAEVATQYVTTNGSIATKVRGTGTVEAIDPYNVVVKETRVIKSVAVKVDDTVEKGDILYALEDSESEELTTAQDELAKLKLDYEKAILNGGLTHAQVVEIENGNTASLQQNQALLEAAQKKFDDSQSNVNNHTAKVNNIQNQIDILKETTVDVTAETNAVAQAQINLNNAQAELENAKALLVSVTPSDPTMINPTEPNYAAAKAKVDAATVKYNQMDAALSNAKVALEQKTGNKDTANKISDLQRQLVTAQSELAKATTGLENAKAEKEALLTDIIAKMDIKDSYDAIIEKQALVEKLKADSMGSTIVAPVSGTISSMGYTAGETTKPDDVAAVILVDGKGYTVSFPVTEQQAKSVSIGDTAEVQNSWYYDDVQITLTNIRNDKDNPGKGKILTFQIKGDSVTAGQSISLSVGQKSSSYDLIVPNSAIREDNNGKFILIVESKSTPFGNRYVASRVDVQVLASDDTQTAILAALYGYEYVITTSTQPVKSGDQVRLAE